jgi:hypothetical protein
MLEQILLVLVVVLDLFRGSTVAVRTEPFPYQFAPFVPALAFC